jgi:hypothetical protein
MGHAAPGDLGHLEQLRALDGQGRERRAIVLALLHDVFERRALGSPAALGAGDRRSAVRRSRTARWFAATRKRTSSQRSTKSVNDAEASNTLR